MMKQEDLFKKLGLILNELNEQYQFLAQNPQQLSELELELFHANANFLADHVQIIKKINLNTLSSSLNNEQAVLDTANQTLGHEELVIEEQVHEEEQLDEVTFTEETPIEEVFEPEAATPEFKLIEEEVFKIDHTPSTFEFILNDHSEHEKFDFEEKSVDELFNRALSAEEEEILAHKRKSTIPTVEVQEVEEEDEIGPEPFLVHQAEVFPIEKEDLELVVAPEESIKVQPSAELVADPTFKPTLNDLLAKTNASNLNATSSSEIKDLKQAINLNDKLLYIKDLFNGYNLAYAEAIDLANKLPNFEAADNFFQKNYALKNNWADKQQTVDKFYSLLNQRFK